MIGSFKLPVPAAGAQDGREVELSVDSGYIVWRYVGDAAWIQLVSLAYLKGAPGDSAYEVAVANGFVGTEAEWLLSLEGGDGDDGIPVEISVQAGYVCWRYVGGASWVQLYQVPTDTFDIYLDFQEVTAFVYNCPAAMKVTSVLSEGTAPTLSPVANTNLAQFQKLTITPAVVGLVILKGVLL